MRRCLPVLATLFLLGVPAAAQAGEPPNQNDPCSSGGRDSCGTTGVGQYKNYKYGLRWFGDYRGAVPGVAGATFCIDLRYWYPGKDYGYEQRSAANGLSNRDGKSIPQGDVRRMAYALWNLGRSHGVDGQGATMLYVHHLMDDGAPGEVDPSAVSTAVKRKYDAIAAEATKFAGPYTVAANAPKNLVVGEKTSITFTVTAASGAVMARTPLSLTATGADVPGTITTNGKGQATLSVTPTSAKDDLQIKATTADLAAAAPDLYVPTKGKSARNGQRLVAPASQTYSTTARADVAPVKAVVTTAATPAILTVGGTSQDIVTITGPGPDWNANVKVSLFGPARDAASLTCAGTPFATSTSTAKAGDTTTEAVTMTTPGLYAYQVTVPSSPDVTGVKTDCPDPTETVTVQAAPKVITQVSAASTEPGSSIFDNFTVTGLSGESASVAVNLYGPFAAADKITCDTALDTDTVAVAADGTYKSKATTLPTPGFYTYKESLKGGDFVVPTNTECAETAETTVVRGHPRIETKVSQTKVTPGSKLSDTAVISGLGKLSAPVIVELWGPFDSKSDIACAANDYTENSDAYATQTFTANGDGEYQTKPVVLKEAGYYTYRESIAQTDAYDAAGTKCGEAAETALAEANPEITTRRNHAVVVPGGKLRDRIRVSGLGATPAKVGVKLYGPFSTRANIRCGGKPYATSSVEVDGDGTVLSDPVTVKHAGFYTFRERIKGSRHVNGTTTECAEEAETALGRPEILTGRNDDVRDVRAAAQGDRRKAPTRVEIPSLGVDGQIHAIGIDTKQNALGIAVSIDKVGWWRDGAAPGDSGVTLLAGHVDSAVRGAGVFYPLKSARRGATVRVTVQGGETKTYKVQSVKRVLKAKLPKNLFTRKGPERLVLVTCGGPFLPDIGHYRDNIILTAVAR
ncbi:MAG: hypothetical protein QOF76_4165 [Solirubrobacteraceae bacterium]|jgi:hypothetical protein|nr:hypothetical protein [Solirubrobacteraceae bacterium]